MGGKGRRVTVAVAAAAAVAAVAAAVEHPTVPSACDLPAESRAQCYNQRWDSVPTQVPSGSGTDGPLAGNGDMGVVLSGGAGLVRIYTGKNDFWAFRDVPRDGCPYTIMAGGWVSLQLPLGDSEGAGGRPPPPVVWTASQDMLGARVNASTALNGVTLSTSTVVAANANVALTEVVATSDVTVNVSLVIDVARYDSTPFPSSAVPAPHRGGCGGCQAAVFAENTHRRLNFASLLPCSPSAIVWPSVRSIRLRGPSTGATLEVLNGSSAGCLVLANDSVTVVHEPDASRCGGAWSQWTTRPSGGPVSGLLIVSKANASQCLTHSDGTPTQFGSRRVTAGRCTCCDSAQVWVLDEDSGTIQAANENLFQQNSTKQCLAAAPPNFNNSLAHALLVVDPDTGEALEPIDAVASSSGAGAGVGHPHNPTTVSFAVQLAANKKYTLILTSVSGRDASNATAGASDDPLPLALSMAASTAKLIEATLADHAAWWASYWASGASVDIGPKRRMLEGWWFGAQYIFGSATRPGKVAPGLWGPWVSGGVDAGWNGDYTIDYNFQANFWGAVSSNRPAFVTPYVDSMMSLLDLGRMRAAAPSWHDGRGFFGPSGQYSQGMQCGHSPTGWAGPLGQCPDGLGNYSGINLPGHFGPFRDMVFPTDMGIRSIGAFAWTPLMQYYEGTRDVAFLAAKAYPYLRGVVDFYSSYLRPWGPPPPVDDWLHVPFSCGDEICSYEPGDGNGLDPMEDLAFARMAFAKAVEYSAVLGVDADLRDGWRTAASRLAPFPTTFATLTPPANATPGGPANCTVWNCTCQGMSDYYGTNAGVGWGCAPQAARTWWTKHQPVCATKSARFPCHDPPTPCSAPGCGARPHSENVTVFAQSRSLATKQPLQGLPYAGYPIVYDAAIHPAEAVTRLSDPALVRTARNTVWVEGLQSEFDPTNGFVLSWIPAARIVHLDNASKLLDLFGAAAAASSAKSWYHVHPGGGYEDVGATEAVNSMLLLSVGGALHFFPAWPLGETASFWRLRAYGAFVVSASLAADGTVGGVSIESEAGAPCTFASPWLGAKAPAVRASDGTPVPVRPVAPPSLSREGAHHGYFAFNTTKGETYEMKPA